MSFRALLLAASLATVTFAFLAPAASAIECSPVGLGRTTVIVPATGVGPFTVDAPFIGATTPDVDTPPVHLDGVTTPPLSTGNVDAGPVHVGSVGVDSVSTPPVDLDGQHVEGRKVGADPNPITIPRIGGSGETEVDVITPTPGDVGGCIPDIPDLPCIGCVPPVEVDRFLDMFIALME